MTTAEQVAIIHEYRAGLDAELTLLHHLKSLSEQQRVAGRDRDTDRLADVTDERDRVMASLVAIEHELRPTRQRLAALKDSVRNLPDFEPVVALHRTAADLVASIVSADETSMTALREAELARRLASRALEMGETTLAAYRRVIAPAVSSASLVDTRG